jgi:hypothetical protein
MGIRGKGIDTARITKVIDFCQSVSRRGTMMKNTSVTIENRLIGVDGSTTIESMVR